MIGNIIFYGVILVLSFGGGAYAGSRFFLHHLKLSPDLLSWHMLLDYQQHYGHIPAIKQALVFAYIIIGVITLLPLVVVAIALLSGKDRELHGSARFANQLEIQKAGLFPVVAKNKKAKPPKFPSLIIGKSNGKFLYWHSNEFVFLAAPTRSGKGVGFIIPNLLHYSDSAVIFDPKGENWDITAGFRSKHGQQCFLFSPDDKNGQTHRWNPLAYVSRKPHLMVGGVMGLAELIYPTANKGGTEAFFNQNAQSLFLGLLLYLIEQEQTPEDAEKTTMVSLLNIASPVDQSLKDWILETIKKHHECGQPLSDDCIRGLMVYAGCDSDNTAAGIMSSMIAPLNIFRDPMVAKATSGNDFDLLKLRQEKMSIYIKLVPDNISKFSLLINLFFNQIISVNIGQGLPESNPKLKYQCLLLMDEFTSLGYMPLIENAIAYIAGYNLRLCLILQDRSQIKALYKEKSNTLINNCAVKIIYTPSEMEDAKYYSEVLGYETVKGKSKSRSFGKSGSRSTSESDQKRALMLPQELLEMNFKDALLWMKGLKIVKLEKILFYEIENLKKRANWAVPAVPYLFEHLNESKPAQTNQASDQDESIDQATIEAVLAEAEADEKMNHFYDKYSLTEV
jgi:type IV secretion system protein VirD4